MNLCDLPDTHPVYVPEIGKTTIGEVRQSWGPDCDEDERTIKMWSYIVTHPHAKPWLRNSGRTQRDSAGSIG